MKGGWLLRKAYKIYQKTYTQLYELFIERFGDQAELNPRTSIFIKVFFLLFSFYTFCMHFILATPLNYVPRQRFSIPRSISYFYWRNSSTKEDDCSNSDQRYQLAF